MRSPFKPHGSYRAQIEGRILVAHVGATFNLEMHYESARIAGPMVRELNTTGPWAYVAVLEETMLYHQDVMAKSGDWVRTKYANQLVAAAWVVKPGTEGYGLFKAAYAKAYQGFIPCEVFHTLDEAKAWLEPQIHAAGHSA